MAAAAPCVVEVRGIVHRYGGGAPALDGVDLEVEAGALWALAGANGSGKTTLLRVLAGILEPTAGAVRLLGAEAPATHRGGDRRRLGYVAQDPALDPEMTAGETLNLFAALYGVRRGGRVSRVRELAAAFGLEGRLERRIEALSGGLKRRLHLAAGMIHDPELLCLDEPAAGLDPKGGAALWAELRRRADRGRATVVVSHDLAAIEQHADDVAILDRGRVVAAGAPRDLVAEHPPSLADAYRELTGRPLEALAPPARRRRRGRGKR